MTGNPEVSETQVQSSTETEAPKSQAEIWEAQQLEWYQNTYRGDTVPQLTVRAVLIGGLLGALMSISNLYTMLKVGWAFGVAITACVLSFVLWNGVRLVFHKVTPMSILENNCMQSTASAAGYSTGATIATAFGAHLLITGKHIDWQILLPWTLISACLGVFLAIPMKRQMINNEKLPFPTGLAAAETLQSLYSKSKESILQSYALISSLLVGATVGVLSKGEFVWQKALNLKLPELLPFNYRVAGGSLPAFGFEPSVLLIGAGMLVGLRVSLSMFLGSLLLYLVVAPAILPTGDIEGPAKLLRWSLWTGTSMMVTSGLAAFAVQWPTIVRAFRGVKSMGTGAAAGAGAGAATNGGPGGAQSSALSAMESIEVPVKWFLVGVIPLTLAMAVMQWIAFSIALPLGILAVVMSFFLALVAARSTGETDITPIGAMGKITQLVYSVLAPSNITTNLMTASVTANTAVASADLLTDLKSGYLLGANPRKQFWAQFIGVFFGAASIVPAWYLMVPNKEALEAFNPPNTLMWKAVAEALSMGISFIPMSARWGILIGGLLGILLVLAEHYFPKYRRFMPSAMGLGLSWVMPFANTFSFFIGAAIATAWEKLDKKSAAVFTVPVAAGAIAGESLASALIAMFNAAVALGKGGG